MARQIKNFCVKMIKRDDFFNIINAFYNEEKSESQIAETYKMSKQTVIKYIRTFRQKAFEVGLEEFDGKISREIIECILSQFKLKYDSSSRKPRTYDTESIEYIKKLLNENAAAKTGKKRALTHLYKLAKENGFKGSYSTFYKVVKKIESQNLS